MSVDCEAVASGFLTRYFSWATDEASELSSLYGTESSLIASNCDGTTPNTSLRGPDAIAKFIKGFFRDLSTRRVEITAADFVQGGQGSVVVSSHGSVTSDSGEVTAIHHVFHLAPTKSRRNCFHVAAEILRFKTVAPARRREKEVKAEISTVSQVPVSAAPAAVNTTETAPRPVPAPAAAPTSATETEQEKRPKREPRPRKSKSGPAEPLFLNVSPSSTMEEATEVLSQFGSVVSLDWSGKYGAVVVFTDAEGRKAAQAAVEAGTVKINRKLVRLDTPRDDVATA